METVLFACMPCALVDCTPHLSLGIAVFARRRSTFVSIAAGHFLLDKCLHEQIKEIKGMRCWVDGYVKDLSGVLLASCVAQLVDLQQLWAAQGQSP